MRTQCLRPSTTALVSLALAAALALDAAPATAGEALMDDPLSIKAVGGTENKPSAGGKLNKKQRRLNARLGAGKPPSAATYRDRAGYGTHIYNGTVPPPTSSAPSVPRVPTFRAPVRRPAPRIVRRIPRLSLGRR